MATLRNKRKLAAVSKETHEYPRNSQSQNSSAPGITGEYIAQVSEEIEGIVTKKLSQEFSRTEPRILGALSKLDKFLLNPQVWTLSGTVPGTFRNVDVENQEPSGDRSQDDPHPEVEFSTGRASNLTDSDPNDTSHSYHSLNCMILEGFPASSKINPRFSRKNVVFLILKGTRLTTNVLENNFDEIHITYRAQKLWSAKDRYSICLRMDHLPHF